jgi:hypothetical protein
MAPTVDDFSAGFAGYPVTSSIDFYVGYSQIPLDVQSHDLTSFATAVESVCTTLLLTGWTVSIFMRIMIRVLQLHLRHAKPFLDDVAFHGPDTTMRHGLYLELGNLWYSKLRFWRELYGIFGTLV